MNMTLKHPQNVNDLMFCSGQAYVHKSVMEELKRIIDDSEITKEDDALWPPPDRVGRQVCLWVQVGVVGVFREPCLPQDFWVFVGGAVSKEMSAISREEQGAPTLEQRCRCCWKFWVCSQLDTQVLQTSSKHPEQMANIYCRFAA